MTLESTNHDPGSGGDALAGSEGPEKPSHLGLETPDRATILRPQSSRVAIDIDTGHHRAAEDGNRKDITVPPEALTKLMELRGAEAVAHIHQHFGTEEDLCWKLGSHPTRGKYI